jgi:hypothetical protein
MAPEVGVGVGAGVRCRRRCGHEHGACLMQEKATEEQIRRGSWGPGRRSQAAWSLQPGNLQTRARAQDTEAENQTLNLD